MKIPPYLLRVGHTGFVSTGSTAPLHRVTWRTVTCPKKECGAGPQEKCRRRISESFSQHTGAGRWAYLKHPHQERLQAARDEKNG